MSKCSIIENQDGTVEVLQDKDLFNNLVEETGSQVEALELWAVAQSEEFEATGATKSSQDIRVFLDNYAATKTDLTPSEVYEVRSLMRENGVETLSELHRVLVDTFKPNGVFDVDYNRMLNSGLYTEDDIAGFNPDQVMDLMLKIEGSSEVIVPLAGTYEYTDSSKKSAIGSSKKLSEDDVYREIVDAVENFQDEAEISDVINALPYRSFVDKYNSDNNFAQEVLNSLAKLKRVPVISIDGGELVSENISTIKTVENTILVGQDTLELSSDIEFLSEVSPEVWQENIDMVKKEVKKVEITLAKMSVDVAGILEVAERRDDIIDLLLAAENMLVTPSAANIRNFAMLKDDLVPASNSTVVRNLSPEYQGLNIVYLATNKSQQELFEAHGLMKVGPNLYHKVKMETDTKSAAYELLYQRYLNGSLEVPSQYVVADKENKQGALEDITKFVMSREVGFKTGMHEEASLFQLVFNHKPLETAKQLV
jgi:hypothetical protein